MYGLLSMTHCSHNSFLAAYNALNVTSAKFFFYILNIRVNQDLICCSGIFFILFWKCWNYEEC